MLEALEDRRLLTASAPSMSMLDEVSPGVFIERGAVLADIAGTGSSVSPAITGTSGLGAPLALNGQGLQFNFIAAPGTPQTVIDGFAEAGQLWSQLIQDDIVVNVDVSFPSLGPGILGSTSPTLGVVDYTSFLAAESADAHSSDDATALAHLQPGPGARLLINGTSDNPNGPGSLTPYVDDNGSLDNTNTYLTYANAKALGLLNPSDPATDANISFSSNFSFDFDRGDGISPGEYDFVGVAAHEIGHALGFGSGIDYIDTNIDQNGGPYPADVFGFGTLDLFRYSAASVAENAIDLTAGAAAGSQYFSIDGGATSLATFATGEIFGDGDQASHWQDGLGIGIMDPTLAPGEFDKITHLDLQALDVIGWDIVPLVVIPDPIIDGTAGDDTFVVTRNPSDTSTVQVELNGVIVETFPLADLNSLTLNGLAGNDTLIVDSSQGLITLPAGIRFDGGTGFDAVQLTQTNGPDIESDELVPGATPGSGLSIVKSPEIIIGAAAGGVAPAQDGENFPAQIVAFQNLEPFTDDLPAPAFDISADVPPLIGFAPLATVLSADNAINYSQSETNGALGVDGTWGKVTIDAFEPIYFTNKDHLTINAGAGSDTVNLNNPATPTALTAITINGDDPTASDTLIVNGTSATEDIVYTPTGVDAGNVTVTGLPAVAFATTEHLVINGQGGNDVLTVSTPNINGAQVLTPGAAVDAGTLEFLDNTNNFIATPLQFLALGNAGSLVSLDPNGGQPDRFVYRGTDQSDVFHVGPGGAPGETIDLNAQISVTVSNMNGLTLAGLDGDDTFNIDGVGGLPFAALIVDGGNPSASDVVNLSNATGPVMVELGDSALSTDTTITGYGGLVALTGVEVANLDADSNPVTVFGTGGADDLHYTPSEVMDGALRKTGLNTLFNFTNVSANLLVDPQGGGDSFTFDDTDISNVINVSSDGTNTIVQSGVFLAVTLVEVNTDALIVNGGTDDDTLIVSSTLSRVPMPITYDGQGGNNRLILVGGAANQDTYSPGPLPGAGTSTIVFAGGTQTVHFKNLTPVIDLVGGPLVVNANDADNAINYIQGLNSGTPIVGNATTGQVSVDDLESIEFANKTTLTINALAGSDTINLNNPVTPTSLNTLFVNGSDPTASDTLIINGRAGVLGDHYRLAPSALGAGTITNLTPPPAPATVYSGIEHLNVVLQANEGDDFAVDGTLGSDALRVTSGPEIGRLRIEGTMDQTGVAGGPFALPSIEVRNLNPALAPAIFNSFNVGIDDTLVFLGTDANDEFELTSPDVLVHRVNGVVTNRFGFANFPTVTVEGLDGDDTFDINTNVPYALHLDGGNPSASDIVNLNLATSAVTINLADDALATDTTVTGFGAGTVTLSGVEVANLAVAGQSLTTMGTSTDDAITFTPTGAAAATIQNAGLNTIFHVTGATAALVIAGGTGGDADRVIVNGTGVRDTIQIDQGARTVQVLANNANALKAVTLDPSIEALTAAGLGGQDTFQIIPAPGVGQFPLDNLLIDVDGGSGGENNALLVADTFGGAPLPATTFVVVNRGATPNAGTVRVFENAVADPDINYQNVQVVSPIVGGSPLSPNLLVMGPDENEPNDLQGIATFLGSGASISVPNGAIFPNNTEFPAVPADVDFYRIVAQSTGTLDVRLFFHTYTAGLLPGDGVLDMEVLDNLGNIVGTVNANSDGLQEIIPVVAGQSYFVRVAGATGNVVNAYSLLAQNVAASVPTAVVLDAADDSGQSNLDDVTDVTVGTHFFVHADLNALANAGITILSPAQAAGGVTPGAAVEVFVNGVSAGYASAVAGSNNTLFEINLDADLAQFAAGILPEMGVTNLITAAVRIFDVQEDGGGAPDPVDDRSLQSAPLRVLFDNLAPAASSPPDLLDGSDSGSSATDNITYINAPAFSGTGEANTIVRIFARNLNDPNAPTELVGEGIVGSDLTDDPVDNGLGSWEVTIEPLADGEYEITTELEDLAGNLSLFTSPLVFTIDTLPPQRPTIELLDNYDTGSSNLDDVTYFQNLQFNVTAEVGSTVNIKDGETVIDTFIMPAASTVRTLAFVDGTHALSVEAFDTAGNRSAQAEQLLLTVDSVAPDPPSVPQLLDASDSGVMGDGTTNVNPPAFKGTGEANAIVRIFARNADDPEAEPELVGEGRVGSDLTNPPEDLPDDPPIGSWEVTIEPLTDGNYEITAELEDLAGNISEASDAFLLTLDTLAPQRPTIDLVNAFDTGSSDLDNVTYLTTLDFRVSAEPGSSVVIKDGNTVVDAFVMPAVPFTIRTISWPTAGINAEGPHPLSAEATDDAGNRSHQSEELLVEIDTIAPSGSGPDLLASSDTGTYDDDDVTNIQALAFQGNGVANSIVRILANGVVVGQGIVGSDLTDPPAELPEDPPAVGDWEVTTEPLDDGQWLITVEYEDLAGNITTVEQSLTVYVDTVLPNTPYLDLTDDSDTGRNNQDNVTNDNTPTVTSTIDDVQGAAANDFPHDIRYRIYDRMGTGPDVLLVDSFATIPGLSTSKFFTDTLSALADGVHNLKLEAEDRAGNVKDFLLQITIDTVAPPVYFGFQGVANDGLDPNSDSGVTGVPDTYVDRITNVTRPTFWGTAEANAIVRLFNQTVGDQFVLGQDVAIPLDGNFAFPNGRWSISSTVDLNDPSFFPYDGLRQMVVTAEDLAGNESELENLNIFLDTQGPQVTDVRITDYPGFNLFGLKPNNANQGPTPLVNSLTIDLQDLPVQDALFLRDAIEAGVAATPGLITVRGDHNGLVEIASINVTPGAQIVGQAATASIELVFSAPLPDDRYTLTINDTVVDIAGNHLDGENNAIEPNDFPLFPSGDGQPGGNFVARFTVDSRPEIGTYAASSIYIDINGNLIYDPQGANNDATNRDLTFGLGIVPSLEGVVSPFNVHDGVFAGNFPGQARDGQEDGGEVAPALAVAGGDGFDKLAAYGYDDLIGKFRWLIDTNNDGIIDPAAGDHATIQPAGYQINGLPVAGDFDGNPNNGDEIGLFDGTKWYFDTNHNWVIDGGDTVSTTNLRGAPIVGDFNGDGVLDLATWRNDQFTFNFGTQPGGAGTQPQWSGTIDATINWGLPGTAEKPVAADMDQDGITDIGLFLPARTGTLPLESGNWEFLLSNDFGEDFRGGNQVTALNHPFSPVPLGNDLFAQFGDGFALPIVGNFDPPVAQPQLPTPQAMPDVLGTLPMGSQTINGDQWYSFTPLRSGTIVVDAATSTPSSQLTAYLYNTDYHLLGSSSATAVAHVSLRSSVVGGQTYLLRLSGDNATANITLTNQVPDYDRLDTSRDGIISPNDALRVINYLLDSGTGITPQASSNSSLYLDTNLDGRISPNDVLQVINYLLDHPSGVVPTTAGTSGIEPLVLPAATDSSQPSTVSAAEPLAGSASVAFAISLSASSSPAMSLVPLATDTVYAAWEAPEDAPPGPADTSSGPLPQVAVDLLTADDGLDEEPLAGDHESDWWN